MIENPPKESEVEVCLIGTGGGYGESMIIKYGRDSWMIIDSCINPNTQQPLALEYLRRVNADLNKVRSIVCTHWHNDHIRGLSELLQECPNAEFSFSQVHDLKNFLLLLELDYSKTKKGSQSSTIELSKCLDIIIDRKHHYVELSSDQVVDRLIEDSRTFVVHSLSPSPKTCADFKTELSELITDFGKKTGVIVNKLPNEKSVALLLSFGESRVLLGGDLEVGKSEFEGWHHVVKHSKVTDDIKANLYKLPHHGSHNGYDKSIFDVLVNQDAILKTTPYRKFGIPSDQMRKVYKGHSQHLYLTSDGESSKPKKREKAMTLFIESAVKRISELKFTHGIVRSRIDYTNAKSTWTTEIFEAAVKL